MRKNQKLIWATAVAIFLFAMIFTICIIINTNTVKVAFLDIPENMQLEITKQIKDIRPKRIKFFTLDSSSLKINDIEKNYNLLVTPKGKILTRINQSIKPLPKNILSSMPTTIKKSALVKNEKMVLPILLDHFEIAYYRTYKNQASLELPQNYAELLEYLRNVKSFAEYPLICTGKNDDELLGFISVMATSILSNVEYDDLVAKLSKAVSVNADLPEELIRILDEIKMLQKTGLIHPLWFQATEKDINFLMKDHKLGAICMSLSEHRQKEFVLIKYYDVLPFPQNNDKKKHYLVAPEICVVPLKVKPDVSRILETFVVDETQKELSDATKLAPTTSRSEAHDSQSSDVRFWAASYEAGPVPSLANECCVYQNQKISLAEKIREFLKN